MKPITLITFSLLLLVCFQFQHCTRIKETPTVSTKDILLKQLKTTHTEKEWFVPLQGALEGLTPEQAMWRDSSGNHSIAQITSHLVFWNERTLAKLNGMQITDFKGDNTETFDAFTAERWGSTLNKLDSVMRTMEESITNADEKKLAEWYATLANVSTHNAYHTGQIVYIRKLQGSWDGDKGVK